MLILQDLQYTLPSKELLFANINLSLDKRDKIALIGNNGSGKSTLLKIVAGHLQPSRGQVISECHPYYLPQIFGQYDHLTLAAALGIEDKLRAFYRILDGDGAGYDLEVLNDDWTIEERCRTALNFWKIEGLDLRQPLGTLSGGEKTKVFLAGISIQQPELILLDEPSNHLDAAGRALLHEFIKQSASTLIVVSHDRKLLNLLPRMVELTQSQLKVYGGDYNFYAAQKQLELEALNLEVQTKERALRKSTEKESEIMERKQKLDARGQKKQEKAGVSRIMVNTLRNKAENSTSKINNVQAEKISKLTQSLQHLRAALPDIDRMKFAFQDSNLHSGKVLYTVKDLNQRHNQQYLWASNVNFEIRSGERLALAGANGSGKTTLIKVLTGVLQPSSGTIYRCDHSSVYIDQDYSLIDTSLTVFEQAEHFNRELAEHEIKIRLNRFLFTKADWDKPCSGLSGGERMRLILCCLTIGSQAPDLIILDEPTNNLDIQNTDILAAAINSYQGTLIVISHDEEFLQQINIQRQIVLKAAGG